MTGRALTAEIVTVGDELLIGQVVNTNQAFIAERVNALGIRIGHMTTVGDEAGEIVSAFEAGWRRSDVLIVTGGLGPTHDDVTRTAVCRFMETDLVADEGVRRNIESLIADRNIPWTAAMDDQTMVPRSAVILTNPVGTAPGLWCQRDGRILVVMPGVPYEMRAIMERSVLPRLGALHHGRVIVQRTLRTTGIPESRLAERIGDLTAVLESAKLAFLPSPRGVRLRITIEGRDAEEARELAERVESRIRSKVGVFLYGSGDLELEEVIGSLLRERDFTLAIAESCTGGEIASRITNVSGSSAYFERGVVAYSNRSKADLLGVPEDLMARTGAVSAEVAAAMAAGVRARAGTTLGLSTTGIAGPTGGTGDKPVGLVWIGVADDRGATASRRMFGGHRTLIKERASEAALEVLRRRILSIDDES
jgi:nicotinamide-nucleotide amidase